MNLVFFGSSPFSKIILEKLVKAGYSPIAGDLRRENYFEEFKKLNTDICIVAAYGKIIPKEYLEVPKSGFLNVHPSLLPKYRGSSPIQAAILNSEKETGVTIIKMDEQIDHGEIVSSIKHKISGKENYKSLEKKLADLGAELLIKTLPKWIKGEIEPKKQNHSETTYTKKFSWLDGKIDWTKAAREIDRQIRALNPEPGVWTNWDGKIIKILEALPIPEKNDNLKTGQVFVTENKKAAIKCGFQTALLIKIIQLEGKKQVDVKDFLNGHKNFIGSILYAGDE
ncbi:MAG: methionyl-tRNA formyltransferase [Patescibacteria group bacterium]